jgi:hypothetical protein
MEANACGAPSYAQESCIFGEDGDMEESTLYWGFRFKISTTDWGTSTSNKTLKMSRLYSAGESIIPGLTGDDHSFGIAGINSSTYVPTGYEVSDTDWHTYVWQLTASTNNDGIIRFWVDGVLEYEDTTADYLGDTLRFNSFPMIQGNLSGGYNGGTLETYWDDYIWATTKAEVDSFFDASSPDTVPPSYLTMLSII